MKKIYFLLMALLISVGSLAQTTVFINEIHYDNSGGDVNEGFEIAGPAGTDLTGWTVAKYNGGNSSVYGTESLSGIIPDLENGYGTIWFGLPSNGLQNGPAEGLALVAADGTTVVQFLSYEGAITAADGPAIGTMSTDIGVSEASGTPVDQSLQLSGSGSTYEDFAWTAPSAHSRGVVNISQTFGAAAPTINTNPTSISGLFYFEGNGPSNEETFSASGVNLIGDITISAPTNFEISTSAGTGFTNSILLEQTGGTVAATTIYVRMVSGLTSDSYSEDIDLDSPGAGSKIVSVSGLVSPADPQISMGGNISGLQYNEGSGPSPNDTFGVSGLFLTNDITVTAPANFEVSLSEMTGYAPSVTLTPSEGTVENTTIYVRLSAGLMEGMYSGDITASSSPATDQTLAITGEVFAAATCAAAGDIVITEIFQNASGSDTNKEWFEVYNNSGSDIDLNSWIISDNGADSHTINASVIVPAGGYAVLGSSADTASNGGVTVNYAYSGINLANGDDEIILTCNSAVIDQVFYDGGPLFPDPDGASMELSSTFPSARNNTDNDDGANWGVATTPFGDGDLGTPGAANDFTLSNDNFDTNGFSIYPNPTATGFVNIKTNTGGDVLVSVFNVLGKQVISMELKNERLDVSNLNTGVYIMRLSQESNTVTKKLIIK